MKKTIKIRTTKAQELAHAQRQMSTLEPSSENRESIFKMKKFANIPPRINSNVQSLRKMQTVHHYDDGDFVIDMKDDGKGTPVKDTESWMQGESEQQNMHTNTQI